jgi:hypothetical protein
LNLGIRITQKEPLKITLSGRLFWIFGLFFILIALGMIIEHEYFSSVFWFLAAFVSLSPISNLIESELNISVSGVWRFLLVIILLAGLFAVYDAHNSSGLLQDFFQNLIAQFRMKCLLLLLEMV